MTAPHPPVDVVIVGAGLAGAATAWFLSRTPGLRIVVVEREAIAGVHSSGRNACLVRTACGDPWLDALAEEGARFLRQPPAGFPGDPGFRATGSFLVGPPERVRPLVSRTSRLADVAEVARTVPDFAPEADAVGVYTATDGVVDVHGLLHGYLAGAAGSGVEIRYETALTGFVVADGALRAVETSGGEIPAARVVIAGGGWAGPLGRLAGAPDRGLQPTRRHLLMARTRAPLPPDQPWVWDLSREFYYRPEPGGVLVSACDQVDVDPDDDRVDEDVLDLVEAKSSACIPSLAPLVPLRLWSGVRTFAPGGRFLLGPDPDLPWLCWAAGLGGHGVTTSAAVGRRVAAALVSASRGAS